jgi:hypothetical protein
LANHPIFTTDSAARGTMAGMDGLGEIVLRTTLLSAYVGLRATGQVLGALQVLTR